MKENRFLISFYWKLKSWKCLSSKKGGDQAFYYYNIEGTLLQDALNYLANVKKVVIGGTSAGCAIQGNYEIYSKDFERINI